MDERHFNFPEKLWTYPTTGTGQTTLDNITAYNVVFCNPLSEIVNRLNMAHVRP